MLKYSDVWLQPLKNNKFKVVKPFYYKSIKIPKGFKSDGASVPFIAYLFNYTKYRPDYLPCAILHDYLCNLELYDKADKCFLNCLLDLKVGKFTSYLFYYAVKFYHFFKYKLPQIIKTSIPPKLTKNN